MKMNVDWPSFLARHDMAWSVKPLSWDDGAWLGNGQIGMMAYAEENGRKRHVLRFVLGHNDVIAKKPGGGFPPRVPIGELDLECVGKIYQPFSMRLHLWDAELRAEFHTTVGVVKLRAFVHSTAPVISIELETSEEERDARVVWYPYPEVDHVLINADGINLNQYIPETVVERFAEGDVNGGVQRYPGGEGCTTAWVETVHEASLRKTYLVTVQNGAAQEDVARAVRAVNEAVSEAPDDRVRKHRDWWHAYYPQSFVSFTDTRLEGFYWLQMYKLACATRADGRIIDNQGPWMAPTPWPGVWFNMNVQMSYSPVYTSNRLEIGESLVKAMEANMDNLIHNVPEPFRHDSAGLGRSCSYDLVTKVGAETGNLAWVCHNLWRQYRHSMDDTMLREFLYPLLRRTISFYLHIMEEGEDGLLHLPPTISPEYASFIQLTVADCHYDLALFRWGCETLMQIADRLKVDDPLAARWQDVLDRLAPLPIGETGYLVGKDQPLEFGHRHFSHLLGVFPLHVVEGETAEERELIVKSLRHWIGSEGDLRGFSFTGAASIAAAVGLGNEALQYARTMLHLFKPNTMYKEAGPVTESPLAGAEAIHDMLLQSWGGIIRVFPAVPDEWHGAVVHDLRTEGAFLVSAKRSVGTTQWIRIRSLAGEPCAVKTDWADDAPVYADVPERLASRTGGIFKLTLGAGEEVVLYAGERPTDGFMVEPVPEQPHLRNFFGGNKPWRLYGLPNAQL